VAITSGLRRIAFHQPPPALRASASTAATLTIGTMTPASIAHSANPASPPSRCASAKATYELKRNAVCTPEAKRTGSGCSTRAASQPRAMPAPTTATAPAITGAALPIDSGAFRIELNNSAGNSTK
jgi:hypothetical protein